MEKTIWVFTIICLLCIGVAAVAIANSAGMFDTKDKDDTKLTKGFAFEAYNIYGQPIEGKKITTSSMVSPTAIIINGGYEYEGVEFFRLLYTVQNDGDVLIDRVRLGLFEWMFKEDYGTYGCSNANVAKDLGFSESESSYMTNHMSNLIADAFYKGYQEAGYGTVTGRPDGLNMGPLAVGQSVTLRSAMIPAKGFPYCIQPMMLQLSAYGEVDSIPCTLCKGTQPENEKSCNALGQVACYGDSRCYFDMTCNWPHVTKYLSISFSPDKTANLNANFNLDIG